MADLLARRGYLQMVKLYSRCDLEIENVCVCMV
jgi:hypothetical protein